MNRISIGVVGRHIGLGLALVCSVTLLTLLFSFLGTIACAAVVGMMVGASRQWRWQGIPVSLVFPAVIAGFVHFEQPDLTVQQSILLPVICFGAFWTAFLLTLAAPYLEGPTRSATESAMDAEHAKQADGRARDGVMNSLAAVGTDARLDPDLDGLLGTWMQSVEGDLPGPRIIEITRDRCTLSIVAVDGVRRRICEGPIKLERFGSFTVLGIANPMLSASASIKRKEASPAWIYKVVGQTLVIASNFEETAGGGAPAIEIYNRIHPVHERMKESW